jgi:hypothetical protein
MKRSREVILILLSGLFVVLYIMSERHPKPIKAAQAVMKEK